MSQRAGEASWLMWQRGQGQEREGPSELGLRSPGKVVELRRDGHSSPSSRRPAKDAVEPRVPDRHTRRRPQRPDPSTPPSRPPPGLTRAESPSFIWRAKAGGWGPEQGRRAGAVHLAQGTRGGEQRTAPSVLIYDEVLQQQRRLLSKLDMEEKKRKEAKEEGYYYDLDESYDESDEEEVKAHLRRVMEQPPLKLDTSSEKVDFLRVCGLTTLAHRDHLLARKRWRRRRLMRERSPAPPPAHGKRKSPSPPAAPAPLTTPYTAEQMDSVPEVEEKKDFLLMFHLSHVSPQQRR
ncbi:unnamed protein product, partial [Tetraodon nigroviridis]